MPSSSLKFELSSGRGVSLAVAFGIALSILLTICAHNGYIPDPLRFLDKSLWDLSTEQADWFTHSVKAMALGVVVCAILIAFIRASGISSINIMESLTIVHSPAGKLNIPTAEVHLREEKLQPEGDYRIILQVGAKTVRLRISSCRRQKLTELLSSAQRLRENLQLITPSGQAHADIRDEQAKSPSVEEEIHQRDQLLLERISAHPSYESGYRNTLLMLVSAFAFAGVAVILGAFATPSWY